VRLSPQLVQFDGVRRSSLEIETFHTQPYGLACLGILNTVGAGFVGDPAAAGRLAASTHRR